jgi:hypothetical protein
MRSLVLSTAAFLLFGAAVGYTEQEKPNLSGTWKLDPAAIASDQANKEFVLVIDEKGENVHIQETRGPKPKDDVSSLTYPTTGQECDMQDGTDKAKAFVYYNGPVLASPAEDARAQGRLGGERPLAALAGGRFPRHGGRAPRPGGQDREARAFQSTVARLRCD